MLPETPVPVKVNNPPEGVAETSVSRFSEGPFSQEEALLVVMDALALTLI